MGKFRSAQRESGTPVSARPVRGPAQPPVPMGVHPQQRVQQQTTIMQQQPNTPANYSYKNSPDSSVPMKPEQPAQSSGDASSSEVGSTLVAEQQQKPKENAAATTELSTDSDTKNSESSDKSTDATSQEVTIRLR